jgi:hypothetical protein
VSKYFSYFIYALIGFLVCVLVSFIYLLHNHIIVLHSFTRMFFIPIFYDVFHICDLAKSESTITESLYLSISESVTIYIYIYIYIYVEC